MKLVALTLGPLLCLAGAANAGPQDPLTQAQMEEDLFFLSEKLESQHAGLRRFTSAEEFDDVLTDALYRIGEGANELEFYRILARVVSRVRCGHTRVRSSRSQREAWVANSGLLPFEVHWIGEQAWVLSTIGDKVPLRPGQEIASIDGRTMREIRSLAFEHLFDDGFIESGKERELEERFSQHYALLVDDPREARRVHSVRLAGSIEAIEVEGISLQAYEARPARAAARPFMELSAVTKDTSRLYVREFDDPGGGEADFPTQLERHFAQMKKDGTANLILDLRGNGGGVDMYGALLVSYLSPKPFRYFDNIRVTADYEGVGDVVERDGVRYVTAHPGLQEQQPAENRFNGRVFIITDGWTFSTAADVAAVSHHSGLATFVGEETGGGYDGNTSGSSIRLTLPNSGLEVGVPQWMYTTANVGHDHFGRGVPPHHAIRPSIDDVLKGRDAEVQEVLERIADR